MALNQLWQTDFTYLKVTGWELEARVGAFVEHYNRRRHHDGLENLAPADVYFRRGQAILLERERIKRRIIQQRRLLQPQQPA